jgi:glycosyltransferase involved in cell wall biosynthesis
MTTEDNRVGFCGSKPHSWPSVERSRQFFLNALNSRFEVELVEDMNFSGLRDEPKVTVNFATARGWNFQEHPPGNLIFVLLGGPVLDRDFLSRELRKLRTSDCLVVNCTADLEIICEICEPDSPQICRLPLPVDTELFKPRSVAECREFANCEEFDYVIGYVSRLVPQKNLHHLLYELAHLRKLLFPARVGALVIGNYWTEYPCLPYETRHYPERIRDMMIELNLERSIVYYPATLSDEELAMCYGAMDVFFHPTTSIDENFGYAPIEAMAAGVPVVGSAYGGLKDTVIDGMTGFLMPTWLTPSGIRMDLIRGRNAVIDLLTDRMLRNKMAEAARRHVLQTYSFEACADILNECVRQSTTRPPSSRFVGTITAEFLTSGTEYLPPVDPPWESYISSIRHYVSGPCPVISHGSWIRLAAPLIPTKNNGYKLVDSAWPATFDLMEKEVHCLRDLNRWRPLTELIEEGCDESQIQQWVECGLLLASNSKPASSSVTSKSSC